MADKHRAATTRAFFTPPSRWREYAHMRARARQAARASAAFFFGSLRPPLLQDAAALLMFFLFSLLFHLFTLLSALPLSVSRKAQYRVGDWVGASACARACARACCARRALVTAEPPPLNKKKSRAPAPRKPSGQSLFGTVLGCLREAA